MFIEVKRMTQTAPAIEHMMSPKSIPDVFEIPDHAALEIPESGDIKRIARLAALALLAIVAGATLALLAGVSPSEPPRVSIVR